ncbi:adenylate/guanylate cyclase domain-containing protein [Vibrio vulnificus]|uniref:adenylate/guanylate cyclase domain-containing protein n=1 Tax=Vibrio TaxID=662 RepID=UPI001A9FD9EB|nr:adenylate/guanylate cyclase domain-containing protein [Vibrio cholerae]MBO1401681.1 hypothetical protein [Vibrio cholerae]HAV6901164.1 adenylate/guanylate cyclase domain-containing protein [Vibrio vulnificus]
MDSLNEVTRKYFDFDRKSRLEKSKRKLVAESFDSNMSLEAASAALPETPLDEYSYQNVLRPLFGKSDLNYQGIGSHPDFKHLEGQDDVELHYIVTMFVDIKGSTRLNLLLDLHDAFYVKNRILQAAIDVVRSLDGHPHRLMGDALMAFFGGKGVCKETAIADAINAAAMLRIAMLESVFPQLDNYLQSSANLAIRVGLDFGDDEEVLWGRYGHGNVCEVTAQGLHVDCASKLQSKASSNHIMMGGNITQYIDFPMQYTSLKFEEKNGSKNEVHYLEPNITNRDNRPINYRMYHLNHDEFVDLLPLPVSWKSSFRSSRLLDNRNVRFSCEVYEDGTWKTYKSVSRFLHANLNLRFKVKVPTDMVNRYGGLRVKFIKKNNGSEAGDEIQPVETVKYFYPVRGGQYGAPSPYMELELPEGTLYRGLHTMSVEVYGNSAPHVALFSDRIGVYIYGKI